MRPGFMLLGAAWLAIAGTASAQTAEVIHKQDKPYISITRASWGNDNHQANRFCPLPSFASSVDMTKYKLVTIGTWRHDTGLPNCKLAGDCNSDGEHCIHYVVTRSCFVRNDVYKDFVRAYGKPKSVAEKNSICRF